MKRISHAKWTICLVGTLLSTILLLGGCTNLTPLTPQSQPTPQSHPSPQSTPSSPIQSLTETDLTVTYSYNATDKVQLSSNDLVLKVGQKLTLRPAPGLTTNTRFVSSGEYFIGNIMKQETADTTSNTIVFTAINPGKGILQIIPNTDQTDRAAELSVTVQ